MFSLQIKTKNKSTKDFGDLFLAQELFIPPSPLTSPTAGFPPSPFPPPTTADADSVNSTKAIPPDLDTISQHSNETNATAHTTNPGGATKEGRKKHAVWCTKFSIDGRYLAVGGKDGVVRGSLNFTPWILKVLCGRECLLISEWSTVWEVLTTPEDRQHAMNPESVASTSASTSPMSEKEREKQSTASTSRVPVASMPVFKTKPLHEFRGHEADVLDLSWSKVSQPLLISMEIVSSLSLL